ncbi:hypothetical protein K501DRAFT_167784 [Backusella circina FSU 941]|nr:hypothetical protein K501DRAFT_167784 [Backusella circina FSU 941]
MVQLSAYAERVIDRLNLIGMWLSLIICARNFFVCLNQYRRSRGKIHLVNIAQVTVFFIHRLLYGIIPMFEISTCAFFPLLVSLWHIDYLLIYIVMFMRVLILEHNRHSTWIKIVGALLISLRFSDWPYELAFHSVQQDIAQQSPMNGETCWAQWGNGVIILNFVGDALANLFLSGMFIRRLLIHINSNDVPVTKQNIIIERIARKSLVCLASTFVVNIIMNIFKITSFLGDRSDAFTVYFEIIESTLLVEALRNDFTTAKDSQFCDNCGKVTILTNDE